MATGVLLLTGAAVAPGKDASVATGGAMRATVGAIEPTTSVGTGSAITVPEISVLIPAHDVARGRVRAVGSTLPAGEGAPISSGAGFSTTLATSESTPTTPASSTPNSVAPPQAARHNQALSVGISSHIMWLDSPTERQALLNTLSASGASWIRIDVAWNALEPQGPGQIALWYRDRLDSVVSAAHKSGMQVLGILMGSPPWANGGKGTSTPPLHPADYGNVAHWLANRYRGQVEAWEIWNEPNMPRFLAGTDPFTYTQLLRAAYLGIKSADSSSVVVMGALAYDDAPWLARVYDAGASGYFDAISTHPYALPADSPPDSPNNGSTHNIRSVTAIRSLMLAHGDSAKPIWFTEIGWSSHSNQGTPAYSRGVSEATQATDLVATLQLVQSSYPYVDHVFWYMDADRTDSDVQENNFGLLHVDLRPKPAYFALKLFLTGHN